MENWRAVRGYEGRYEVSDMGRVRVIAREQRQRRGDCTGCGQPYGEATPGCRYCYKREWRRARRRREPRSRILTGGLTDDGYRCLNVKVSEGTRKLLVHRLVLEAFVGPCPEGMETRHLNGVAADCRLSNLTWGTRVQNRADRTRHERERRGNLRPCN